MRNHQLHHLGEHISLWRETVLKKTPLETTSLLDQQEKRLNAGNTYSCLKWTLSEYTRIENGDSSLPFSFWISVMHLMGTKRNVLEAALNSQDIFLAHSELHSNRDEEANARRLLAQRSIDT